MSDFLNNSYKYVASRTLRRPDWGPASLVRGDLADELLMLRQQPGKNITVPGGPRLVRSLLQDGLLDELTLGICPIVVGRGLRLFEDMRSRLPLKVVRSVALSTGIINVTYQPAGAHQALPNPSVGAFPAPEREQVGLFDDEPSAADEISVATTALQMRWPAR